MSYWDDVGFAYQRPPGLINAPIRRDTRRKQLEEEQARRTYQGLLERDLIGIQQFSPFFGLNSRDPDAIPIAPMDVVPAGAVGKGVAGLIAAGTGGLLARQLMKQPVNRSSVSMMGYHGGPTKWAPELDAPLGRPRLEHMGEGEGAQAYGHGFYVAQEPDVAIGYVPRDFDVEDKLMSLYKRAERGGDYDSMTVLEDLMLHRPPSQIRKNFDPSDYDDPDTYKRAMDDVLEFYEGLEKKGSLYKMDIPDADVAKMLDWDKPLSEQPKAIQSIIQNEIDPMLYGARRARELASDPQSGTSMTGGELYQRLEEFLAGKRTRGASTQKVVSEYLASKGIPGLKYLDQGSRTAGVGTRNMVLWDEDLLKRIKVLERE